LDGNHNSVVQESPTLDLFLIQIIAGNTFKPHFLRIYVNIILPCVGEFLASKFIKACHRHAAGDSNIPTFQETDTISIVRVMM